MKAYRVQGFLAQRNSWCRKQRGFYTAINTPVRNVR